MHYGLIGTGLMGAPMAQQLLAAELPLIVYNRTVEKTISLAEAGATVADTPEQLLQTADCIMMMVTHAEAIRETVLAEATRPLLAGKTLIQMSTIGPQESRDLCGEVIQAGGEYFECPVLGSIPEAQSGALILMVGATSEQFQRWLPLLQRFGPEPRLIGSVGSAMALKLAMNQLIGSLTSAFALSLGFAQRQGVEIETLMQILRQSALYAPTFDKKLDRMVNRRFDRPNFPSKHLAKDMRLFRQEAEALGMSVENLAGVEQILERAMAQGLSDQDYSALYEIINPQEP